MTRVGLRVGSKRRCNHSSQNLGPGTDHSRIQYEQCAYLNVLLQAGRW
jgi:hypothetical protein